MLTKEKCYELLAKKTEKLTDEQLSDLTGYLNTVFTIVLEHIKREDNEKKSNYLRAGVDR